MTDEVWKPVPAYGGHYEASSLGRIRSLDRVVTRKHTCGKVVDFFYKGRLLSPAKSDECGHLSVHIGIDCKRITVGVHRMVLLAFVGESPAGHEACHNNGIAWDNRAGNLRWDTHLENNRDRLRHGTYAMGEKHPMARLSNAKVQEIRGAGIGYEEAAAKFGISRTQAHRILTMRSRVNG